MSIEIEGWLIGLLFISISYLIAWKISNIWVSMVNVLVNPTTLVIYLIKHLLDKGTSISEKRKQLGY